MKRDKEKKGGLNRDDIELVCMKLEKKAVLTKRISAANTADYPFV